MSSDVNQPALGNRQPLGGNPKARLRLQDGLEVKPSQPVRVVVTPISLAARKSIWTLLHKSASEEPV
jgi:hypothetical protein